MELEEWLEIDEYVEMQTGAGPVAMSEYTPPREQVVVRMWGTGFEVGQLTVHTVDEKGQSEPGCIPMTAHPMHLMMHPAHGIAVVQVLAPPEQLDARDYLREKVEWAQEDAEILRELIRDEICDDGGFWSRRLLPVEPVFIRFESADDVRSAEIGAETDRVVEADWDDLPEAVGRVPERRMPETRDRRRHVERLIEAIPELDHSWIGHRRMLETWEVVSEQLPLEESMDRAA